MSAARASRVGSAKSSLCASRDGLPADKRSLAVSILTTPFDAAFVDREIR
jgi:hypothetical protein